MKIATKDLTGAQLDWAVAKAIGWINYPTDSSERGTIWHTDADKAPFGPTIRVKNWRPSSDWGQCGPLLSSYKVGAVPMSLGLAGAEPPHWITTAFFDGASHDNCYKGEGSDPLTAICRAVVGLRMGDEVEVPDELEGR